MSQKVDIKIKGLFTNPNNFSEVPAGALAKASNVVINRESIVETRKGQTFFRNELSREVDKLFIYKKKLLVSYNNKIAYESGEDWVDYEGNFTAPDDNKIVSVEANKNFYFTSTNGIHKLDDYGIGTKPVPAGVVQGLDGTITLTSETTGTALNKENQYAYRVVWGYKDKNGNLILGAPSQRMLITNSDPTYQKNANVTFTVPFGVQSNWFYQLYRSGASGGKAIEANDEMQIVYEGYPTQAELNALSITVKDITPNDLRGATLYTSPSQQGILNSNYQPPFANDMTVYKDQVLYANCKTKARLTLSLISVGDPTLSYKSIPITVSIGSKQATTSSTEGFCTGMRLISDTFTNYIDTVTSSTTFTLRNESNKAGSITVEAQDYIGIGKQTFFAGSKQDFTNNTFKVELAGTVGYNIGITATNIVTVINNSLLNTNYYAYYQSGFNDLAGKFLIEERSFSDEVFAATSSSGIAFSPILDSKTWFMTTPNGLETTIINSTNHGLVTGNSVYITNSVIKEAYYVVTVLDANRFTVKWETIVPEEGAWIISNKVILSSNDRKQNRIFVSKKKQPEAVPLLNFIDVGSADEPILKVIALRDSTFVFKRDGVFRISGDNPSNMTVDLLDNTVTVRVPESVVTFNNQVFAFSDQGIIAVSDSGVAVMSRPIENTLIELSSDSYVGFDKASFGVSYESDRQYIFYTISDKKDNFATQAFVYNAFTDTWTNWKMSRSCGIVNSADNKLYMANPVNKRVYQERKNYNNFDYADESFTRNAVELIDNKTFQIDDMTEIVEGMSLKQGGNYGKIVLVENDIVTIENKANNKWETGEVEVSKPILTEVEFQPNFTDNMGMLKHFREMTFVFSEYVRFQKAEAYFVSNFVTGEQYADIIPMRIDGWGTFPWGSVQWGGRELGHQVVRVLIPNQSSRAIWLNIGLRLEESYTNFSLAGMTITYNQMSERFK